ncbi:MAG: multicopper oxidase domain-containing protein, partial [Victivallales bacterium]
DVVMTTAGGRAILPYPAPKVNSKQTDRLYEIPIAVQDRSFNLDGSLFYPDTRAFFDGFTGPYIPDPLSDISPIYNPEYFGNTIIVNGKTWPYFQVEQRRYRFRMLNGCTTRTLILQMDNGMPFWQIGSEQGFLPAPVSLTQLVMGSSERADVIVDFTNVPLGTNIMLQNVGPDEPFNGAPGFLPADPTTTGQVMQLRVIARRGVDISTPPNQLVLPARTPLPAPAVVRQLSLNELDSNIIPGVGPRITLLGPTVITNGVPAGVPMNFDDPVTEKPLSGDTETWEIYNMTVDAHPVHLHQVAFEVVNREIFDPLYGTVGTIIPPAAWETGTKDTAYSYPGEILRIKAKFDVPGRFVWHCHIVDHEDNEMMRPMDIQPGPLDMPAAPTLLRVSRAYTMAFLSWQDNANNERAFNIERGLSALGPFAVIGTVPANTRFFMDRTLVKGTPYFYRVNATNNYGVSAYSNTAP